MQKAIVLLEKFVRSPGEALDAAADAENCLPAIAIGAAACFVEALACSPDPEYVPTFFEARCLGFLVTVFTVWFAGMLVGGRGSILNVAQVLGLVSLPAALLCLGLKGMHVGLLALPVSWIALYCVVKTSHALSSATEVVLVLILAMLIQLPLGAAIDRESRSRPAVASSTSRGQF